MKLLPHLQQPVQQDGPHLGLQAGVSLQVTLVMKVLQVLVQHADPHVVRTGPAAPQEPQLLTIPFQHVDSAQMWRSRRSSRTESFPNVLVLLQQNTHLRRGMGDALIKRFLKRYCRKPDGSTGSSSLWGVSTRTQGVAPSSDQHFYKRNKNFRVTARVVRTGITLIINLINLISDHFYKNISIG